MNSTAFEGYPQWVAAALAVTAVLVVAYFVAEVLARGAWRLIRPLLGERATGFAAAPLLRPIRLIRAAVFLLVTGTLLLPALELAGVRTFVGLRPAALMAWFFESGLRVGLILLLSYAIVRITSLVVGRLELDVSAAGGADFLEHAKRIRTLGNLLRSTVAVLVTCIATLMILRELHLDITPILTGAGIAGLAVGFGAQTLVKDVISGFFLLLENQVRVGDVAAINGTGGLVESITLRTISLRDQAGTVHIFPNGSITTLANMTKDFAYYVLDVGVSYSEDTDRVVTLLRDVAAELQRDERFGPLILEPLEVLGVENFTESCVLLRVRIKTLPIKQWDVGRELRRRLKKRFDAEGIEFPYRQLVLHVPERGAVPGTLKPAPASAPAESESPGPDAGAAGPGPSAVSGSGIGPAPGTVDRM